MSMAPSPPPADRRTGLGTHHLRDTPGVLGVLGGGQLGRMFVHAAQTLGLRVVVLDPAADSPAGAAADQHLCAGYEDAAALDEMARLCGAITTEFENVPAAALRRLGLRRPVSPSADAVAICQHRAREKAAFTAAGVACAPHAMVDENVAEAAGKSPPGTTTVAAMAALLPGILKTASLGYDGKGQQAVARLADLPAAWAALGRVPCVLEQRLPLHREFSVVVARGRDGACVHLPVQQNLHADGILVATLVPAPDIPAAHAAEAIAMATRMAVALQYVGVLCIEFFLLEDGSLCANEMAPRPHNSGHHSIDSCDVSQFDLQVRTLAGLPLVAPRQHSAAVMLNLLGDLWFTGDAEATAPDWNAVLSLPGAHLHLYGKTEPRRGRKMGHLTLTAATAADARATAQQAARRLGITAWP